jgi:acyl-[acyl-carrier-protein]-phospholipid O-acyltransferase/long-chain-fatty-acid--[acyl-carrier-protein] ligase
MLFLSALFEEFGLAEGLLVGFGVLLAICLLLFWFKPFLLVRIFLWLIAHTIYKLRIRGVENIPATGPALLVCNHVSYFDWLFLTIAQKRVIRFVIFAGWTRKFGMRHLLKWAGVIPIDKTGGLRSIVQSLRQASEALKRGELVCIFAEGRFTRTGFLLPFQRGFEQIVKNEPAPIIPVCLEQLWGSIFSYWAGSGIWKWPLEMPYPVTVAFGKPLPPDTKAPDVRQAVQELSAEGAVQRSSMKRPVHRQFVRMASKHPFRTCIIDPVFSKEHPLSYGKVLAGCILLSRLLRPRLHEEDRVGVWLPPGAPGVMANIALALLGKTSVNLNYTAGASSVQSAIQQCGLKHVLTSKAFAVKVSLDAGQGVTALHLEELFANASRWQRMRAYLNVLLLPAFVLDRWVLGLSSHRPTDIATIIFSSGSTGEPKGVMLSHRNLAANAESIIQAIDPRRKDRILGILPLFHSFGYTVTMWVPLQVGASVVYQADPRQSREIGELCRTHHCTLFLVTPTFLRLCMRRCDPHDFDSLRFLWCGAEKLPPALAKEFEDRFRLLPMEGYGCTELSPAAVVNVPDRNLDGFRQVGHKPGTIGQPLPGVAARVVDPESFAPLPVGQEGLLLIRGGNVMEGYLGKPEETAQVIRAGWYVTGDMVTMDEDGFITITGRLSRFSKIGGEMVPHQRIEDEIHSVLGTSDRVCVVTAVPDESKGERLVVLHSHIDVKVVCKGLTERGLPNLWLPRERDFLPLDELPMLGTGKADLKKCKEIALAQASER